MIANVLSRFRATTARMDPTRPLQSQDEQQDYVQPPHTFGEDLARALQLEPTTSMLLVGSIGVGKSTELLAAGRLLMKTPGIFARYVDVSAIQALELADYRAVLVAIAEELVDHLVERDQPTQPLVALQRRLKVHADGYEEDPNFYGYDDSHWVAGVRTRPRAALPDDATEYLDLLKEVRTVFEQTVGGQLIWLLDGLDKLPTGDDFDRIVNPVVTALAHSEIGLAVVAPRKMLSGVDQLGSPSAFGDTYFLPPWDPEVPESRDFLLRLLGARDVHDLISPALRGRLVDLSGGVPRMLVQLARFAVREAYIRNAIAVAEEHVELAGQRLGRDLLMGLTDGDVALLDTLRRTGLFAPKDNGQLVHVAANRVLEHVASSGRSKFTLHPTLVPLISALGPPTEVSSDRERADIQQAAARRLAKLASTGEPKPEPK